MRHIVTFIMIIGIILSSTIALAQEAEEAKDGWDLNANLSLNLTQSSYSDNWEGGELGAISWTALGLMTAEKQLNPKINWNNNLRLAYGQTHTQEESETEPGEKEWQKPKKSTDEVDFESVLRFTLHTFIDPYVSGRLLTRFTNENNDLFDPKEFSESAGVARQFIKKDNASLVTRLGFTLRQRVQKDVDTTNDGGLEFVMDYHRTMSEKKITFDSKMRVFQALFYSESDTEGVNDDWKTADLDWKNTLNMQVVEPLAVNLFVQFLYDKDHQQDDGVQIKQTLGVGLSYKLF